MTEALNVAETSKLEQQRPSRKLKKKKEKLLIKF